MAKYYTPSEYLCVNAEALKAVVGTQDGERFVILYDRFDEISTIVSLPAKFDRDINDGDINPLYLLVKVGDGEDTVITRDSIGMPIYQSVEEYVGLDDVYCVIRNGYVSINCNDMLVRRLRLDNLKEELPEGYVDNKDITIVIDSIETFAVYNK